MKLFFATLAITLISSSSWATSEFEERVSAGLLRPEAPGTPFDGMVEAWTRGAHLAEADYLGSWQGETPVPVLIPRGRSRQRSGTTEAQPRVVLELPSHYGPATFVGYAEASDELEVISWDRSRGRYEFHLLTSYLRRAEGKAPTWIADARSRCLACHQGGLPIFSRAPWEETNFSQTDLFVARDQQLSGPTRVAKAILQHHPSGKYLGLEIDPWSQDKAQIAAFNRIARINGFGRAIIESFNWSYRRFLATLGCGEDTACRAALLRSALAGGWPYQRDRIAGSDRSLFLTAISRFKENSRFLAPSPVLVDRDPSRPENQAYSVVAEAYAYTIADLPIGSYLDIMNYPAASSSSGLRVVDAKFGNPARERPKVWPIPQEIYLPTEQQLELAVIGGVQLDSRILTEFELCSAEQKAKVLADSVIDTYARTWPVRWESAESVIGDDWQGLYETVLKHCKASN